MGRLGLVAAITLTLGLASAPARAQGTDPREQARALMREGTRLYQEGEYLQALERFQKVWDLVQTPKVHFNLGETFFQLGRPLDALRHYELFVQGAKEEDQPELWARANVQISKLQGQVATVLVRCPVVGATVTVDGKLVGKTPMTQGIRLLPGPHVILVTRPGYEQVVLNLTLGAAEVTSPTVELLTEEAAASKRQSYQRLEAQRRVAQERLRVAQEASRSRTARTKRALRLSGWTALGVGVAALAAGGACGLRARSEASTIESAKPGTFWVDLEPNKNRYDTYRQVAYYGIGIGAGLAVAGGVALLVSYRRGADESPAPSPASPPAPEPRPRLSATPALGPGQLGVLVRGSF